MDEEESDSFVDEESDSVMDEGSDSVMDEEADSLDESGDPEPLGEQLTRACRTLLGDELRSITFFTEDGEAEQVYLRDDLEANADLVGFVDHERQGFRSREAYANSELGGYRYTIRSFEHGYLTRVLADDRGAFVTTDEMTMERFDDLANAVSGVLEADN